MSENQQKIHQHESYPRLALKLVDALSIVAGLIFLLYVNPESNSRSTIIVGLVAIGVFSWFAEFLGVYRNWRGIAFMREANCTMLAWGFSFFILATLGRFTEYSTEISSHALLMWFAISPSLSIFTRSAFRLVTRWMIRRGIRTRKFAIAGLNVLGEQLAESINKSPDLGYEFVGFFDDRCEIREEAGSECLGNVDALVARAKSGEIQVVFITIPMRAEERIRGFISELSDTTASVYIVPDLFVFQLLHSRWTEVQGVPVVSVFENPFYGIDGWLKRTLDIILASIFIAVAAIPMLIIALLVKLTSRGPVFFKQSRYGLDGKEIKVWKLRSMTVCENGNKVVQATANDSRITKLGAIL
ncbi:MAG: sugar transferase, partial [Planctomycetota bacterium]